MFLVNQLSWSSNKKVRPLGRSDIPKLKELAKKDEISNCFILNRLNELENYSWSLQNEIVICEDQNEITSALYLGANIVPLNLDENNTYEFAQFILEKPRKISSIVGDSKQVMNLWQYIKTFSQKPREIRETQPLLVIDEPALVAPDLFVNPVNLSDLETVLPACVSMFTEEVGVSPVVEVSEQTYRNRISEVINQRKMFARIENGQVIFKAEIGINTEKVCQVQGVWVPPHLRGRNLGKAGMARVVQLARQHFSPLVSLYVNDYNERARSVYKSVGFREHSTFATVLF